MNRQAQAIGVSLLLHALLVWGAVALNQHGQSIRLPLVLDFSILASAKSAEAAQETSARSAEAAPETEPAPPPPVEKKVWPKPVVKRKSPPQQMAIRQSLPSAAEETPPVETIPVAAGTDASASQDNVPEASEALASAHGSGGGQARGNSGDGIFSIGQLDGPLTALSRTPPVYPPAAKRQNIEGWIKVKFVVDQHGQVEQISVLAAEPKGIFEQSVLRCISHWRFKPAMVNGMVVKVLVEQTVTFKLEG